MDAIACTTSLTNITESEIKFTGEELRRISQTLLSGAAKRGKKWRAAVVAEKPLHFGVARQDQMFTDGLKESRVFPTQSAARAWLLGGGDTDK